MIQSRLLKHNEILLLAEQARLMLADDETRSLNKGAGEEHVLAFARLLETRLQYLQVGCLAGDE